MPQATQWTRNGRTAAFVAGGTSTIELERGQNLRELWLNLAGSVTGGSSGNWGCLGAWDAVQEIAVVANGRDELVRVTPRVLYALHPWLQGGSGWPRVDSLSQGVQGSTVTVRGDALCIPFWSLKSQNTMDAFLPTGRFSSLELQIRWSTLAQIGTNIAAATLTMSATAYHALPVTSKDSAVPSSTTRLYRVWQEAAVAAQDDYLIRLPVNGSLYRALLLVQRDANGAYVNSLGRVRLDSGNSRLFVDGDARTLRLIGERKILTVSSDDGTGFMYNAKASFGGSITEPNTPLLADGHLLLDPAPDDSLTEGIATTMGLADLTLRLQTTATSNIELWAYAYVPFK